MPNNIIAFAAPVEIKAADGESKGPPRFEVVAYTGGPMMLGDYDLPVVVDLAGMKFGNSLIANLDHKSDRRVGHVTSKKIVDGQLILAGVASAATDSRREVVESAANGFVWQASIEASVDGGLQSIAAGKTVTVNGQTHSGPIYLAGNTTLKGFGFVSHGADDGTVVSIAAEAAQENYMNPELKQRVEAMGFEADSLTAEQVKGLEANFAGQPAPRLKPQELSGFDKLKAEQERKKGIQDHAEKIAAQFYTRRELDAVEEMATEAIEAGTSIADFKLATYETGIPVASSPRNGNSPAFNSRVIEAAICQSGRLKDIEAHYSDQELQAAHDQFRQGIGLNQVFFGVAEAQGHRSNSRRVDADDLRAAFGFGGQSIKASGGFSSISIGTILSNVANKFLMRGWDTVDLTCLRIAAIRPVSDFKQITTVSLTGDLTFEQLGPGGEIAHGKLSQEVYSNQADTYAKMLGITRKDFINDDLGALTDVPRKLGRGAALKLNDIFWAEFLNNSAFFTTDRGNVSTDTGALGLIGLEQADTIFMNQTNPEDGSPLGIMPEILLVPTALKTTANTLMTSEKIKGDADEPDGNVWRGRFRVESSPYMSNGNYTGNSAAAWYLLADPEVLPVIEIAALNGRVEPVVETADADFNTLGVQMRGYSDVGVAKQEYRGGVRADGSAG